MCCFEAGVIFHAHPSMVTAKGHSAHMSQLRDIHTQEGALFYLFNVERVVTLPLLCSHTEVQLFPPVLCTREVCTVADCVVLLVQVTNFWSRCRHAGQDKCPSEDNKVHLIPSELSLLQFGVQLWLLVLKYINTKTIIRLLGNQKCFLKCLSSVCNVYESSLVSTATI